MKKTTEDKPKRKRISKADKAEVAKVAELNERIDSQKEAYIFHDQPIVSLRGDFTYLDKDYILMGDEWRYIPNSEAWNYIKRYNKNAQGKKKYISKAKFVTLKIGKPLSI